MRIIMYTHVDLDCVKNDPIHCHLFDIADGCIPNVGDLVQSMETKTEFEVLSRKFTIDTTPSNNHICSIELGIPRRFLNIRDFEHAVAEAAMKKEKQNV